MIILFVFLDVNKIKELGWTPKHTISDSIKETTRWLMNNLWIFDERLFDEQNKLISIITPSLNSERYIGEAIQSVINQSYPYWELLIVDGGSSDKTIDIIEKFSMSDSRIKLIHNKNDNGTSQTEAKELKKQTENS